MAGRNCHPRECSRSDVRRAKSRSAGRDEGEAFLLRRSRAAKRARDTTREARDVKRWREGRERETVANCARSARKLRAQRGGRVSAKQRASSALPLCRRAKPEARSVAKGREACEARHRRKRARRAAATGEERGDGHRDPRQSRARRSRDPHTSRSNYARAQHTGNAEANSRARPARRRAGLAKRLYSLASIVS